MPRDEFLKGMVAAGEVSLNFVNGRRWVDLESDVMFRDALVKAVEIIGEAASQVSNEFRAEHPVVRWMAITTM